MEKYRTLSIGRSLAVAGHANHPLTYYFGATGGGVWKTIDEMNGFLFLIVFLNHRL
jgi:hypothetical protein